MAHLNLKNPINNTEPQTCIRRYGGSENAQLRLICFPWAGAGASVYRRFAYHLSESIELFSVQYPGREDRYNTPRIERMDELVQHVISGILPLIDHRPIIFFGHSMGALVAYEVVQSLKIRLGWEPDLLIVSGSASPENEKTYERCPSDANEDELIAEMKRLGGTPPELLDDPQMMKTLLPVLRADYAVLDHYVSKSKTPLLCPLIACAGDEDSSVSEKTVDMWRQSTTGTCKQFWFSGDHFYFSSNPVSLLRNMEQWIVDSAQKSQQENIVTQRI